MRFTCPSCNSSYRLSRERLGATGQAKIKCPKCKALVRVKAADDNTLSAALIEESGGFAPAAVSAPAAKAEPSVTRATQPRTVSGAEGQSARPATGDPAIWHVAVGRKAEGPHPQSKLTELLAAGTITGDNLVWRKGQEGWQKLAAISALKGLLQAEDGAPPPVAPIKHTLKTGAAAGAVQAQQDEDEDERTVMQDVVSEEMLARTGSDADRDDSTVMADVVSVPGEGDAARKLQGRSAAKQAESVDQRAVDAAEARTLKPGRKSDGQGARLPSRTAHKGPRTASAAARSAADAATKTAADRSAAAKPATTNEAAPRSAARADAQQAARSAAQQAAKRTGGGGAKKPMPIAQSASFFETGEQLNADFDLQMPDPNKHKPTKEEYQNLLQEFSVMFRLDKRGKRQKVLITVVLASLLIGVIGFGVTLYLQGQERQALLRDSKTILAVFALPYQQNADFDLTPEEDIAEGSAIHKKKVVSILASELLTKNKKKIETARAARKKTKSGAMAIGGGGSGILQKKYTKEERDALEAKRKAAIAAALGGGYGGKVERVMKKTVLGAKALSKSELRRMCGAKAADLQGCGRRHAGGAGFKAQLHISTGGMIDKVTCRVEGKLNIKLSACAEEAFARVRKPPQPAAITHVCAVSGS